MPWNQFYSFSFAFKKEKSHICIFLILCYNPPKTAADFLEQETEGFCSKELLVPVDRNSLIKETAESSVVAMSCHEHSGSSLGCLIFRES